MEPLTPVEEHYFKFLLNELSLKEFEHWVYSSELLEQQLNSEQYFNLIDFNYQQPMVAYELSKILKGQIDYGKLEIIKLTRLMKSIIERDKNAVYSIARCYDLYCAGYGFLEHIGMGFGIYINLYEDRDRIVLKFNGETIEDMLNKMYQSSLKERAVQVINWLEDGLVVPTGEQDEIGHWGYTDFRTDTETLNEISTDSKNSFWGKLKNFFN